MDGLAAGGESEEPQKDEGGDMCAPVFQEPAVGRVAELFAEADDSFPKQDVLARGEASSDPGRPYQSLDLLARRTALGLQREDVPPVLDVGAQEYAAQEDGVKPVKRGLVKQFENMEVFVAELAHRIVAEASAGSINDVVVLEAVTGQEDFMAAYPQARRVRRVYPYTLQYVAVGRAAAELTRRGYTVEIYRGGRRADLAVRRHAVGLRRQKYAAALLGLNPDKYSKLERNERLPAAGLLAELQAVDDFITAAVGQLTVDATGAGIGVIRIPNTKHQFENAYPQARTQRGNPYPVEVLRVAAARRAGDRVPAGQHTHIAAADA